mgnify:CR=1 FL=1
MDINELQFRNTCIEYLKNLDSKTDSIELQTIISRSDICLIKTVNFHRGRVWNQYDIDIELRVPIPLLRRAKELHALINKFFEDICPEDNQYGYGHLNIKPKMIGADDITYKEYDVVFENIKQTIIQGIRDAKYVIWIAVAWFTNREIFDELCLRKKDGLNIRVITIGDNSNKWILDELDNEFDTLKITLPGGHLFHHKFCIIDFEYVMHGSFNWSKNAEGNEETWATALDRDFSKKFADKFMRMYRDHIVDEEDIIPSNGYSVSSHQNWEDLF